MLELKIHQAQLIVREIVFSKFIAQTLSLEINQSPQALIGKVGRIYFRLNQTSIVAGNTVGEGLLWPVRASGIRLETAKPAMEHRLNQENLVLTRRLWLRKSKLISLVSILIFKRNPIDRPNFIFIMLAAR